MNYPTKEELLLWGQKLVEEFCRLNSIDAPGLESIASKDWKFSVCAYYRPSTTRICLAKCAAIEHAGMAWSYPGYTVDRTPYGVLAHELGHHVDVVKSDIKRAYYGDFSVNMQKASGEDAITSYGPNPAEWFAEMFRVFVTNPDLLRLVRPRTHRLLSDHFKPVFHDTWCDRLANAPARTIAAAARKVGCAPSQPTAQPST